jgi:chlorophyllide a reductase subunit Y
MAAALDPSINVAATRTDGLGCHAGKQEMRAAAAAAGKSATLAQYSKDYPTGPHDQPQSMCPAFGSLRVGLRMRRTATVLSGSACCVYGLTFTSHFYGARRPVNYVPFNSETLVTGKLFEDIREAVFKLADPALYDAIVIINLCVPTASGVPLQLLPKDINGVRIIGIDVPGFGVPTHAEAKDVLAGAMLRYARSEVQQGPVQAPRSGRSARPTVTLGRRNSRLARAAKAGLSELSNFNESTGEKYAFISLRRYKCDFISEPGNKSVPGKRPTAGSDDADSTHRGYLR